MTAPAADSPVLRLKNVKKRYNIGLPSEQEVLHGIDLSVGPGEFLAMVGPSGSGKSTLLNILGLLDQPSDGEVFIAGRSTRGLSDGELSRLRGERLGFVFQFHHLLTAFTALDNIQMPCWAAMGRRDPDIEAHAQALLASVGLDDYGERKPKALSGGQQQRVAICRALINRPPLVLADEPTGNLDTESSEQVFDLLRRFNREFGCAFIIVTHDLELAEKCDRVIELVDGRILDDRSGIGVPS
ncbi:ABC transporter ATP-binding protein [Gammaproteobacteria bacterium AB-CW1]|uniref:ABC transporter ATP-binding protein n=1 Tax=Natronospira elongata TaxID=3110268 RepID=A0AAP6JG72_9GAMM|nr:ABC transporter ATP-binding protein [Gammaproteobacteria bacterium AB-CW1]